MTIVKNFTLVVVASYSTCNQELGATFLTDQGQFSSEVDTAVFNPCDGCQATMIPEAAYGYNVSQRTKAEFGPVEATRYGSDGQRELLALHYPADRLPV
jgi:hypothetical protein